MNRNRTRERKKQKVLGMLLAVVLMLSSVDITAVAAEATDAQAAESGTAQELTEGSAENTAAAEGSTEPAGDGAQAGTDNSGDSAAEGSTEPAGDGAQVGTDNSGDSAAEGSTEPAGDTPTEGSAEQTVPAAEDGTEPAADNSVDVPAAEGSTEPAADNSVDTPAAEGSAEPAGKASEPTIVTEWPNTSGTSNSSWLFEGDVIFNKSASNYFYGSGNTITINGSLTLTDYAKICMDSSSSQNTLIVKGDLNIINGDNGSWAGRLEINGSNNTLIVEGNLTVKAVDNFTNEGIKLRGTNNALLIQKDMALDGCRETVFQFYDSSGAKLTVDGNLTLDGCTGTNTVNYSASKNTTLTVKGNMALNSGSICMNGAGSDNFVINGDCTLNGGGIAVKYGSLTVGKSFLQNGGDLEISGTLEVSGDFKEEGGTITLPRSDDGVVYIKGSFLQNGGTNSLYCGKFTVDGSFQMGTAGEMQDGYRLASSSGSTTLGLTEQKYPFEMNIGGDLIICTSGSFRSYSNYNDTFYGYDSVKLGGNLYQYGNYSLDNAAAHGYAPSNNLQVSHITFTGEGKQCIFMDSTDSYFEYLGAENTNLWVDTEIKFLKLSGDVTLHVDSAADYNTFLLSSFSPSLQGYTLTIDGNVLHESGKVSYDGGKMAVTGDYTLGEKGELLEEYITKTSTGSIDQGKGTLEVGGTLTLCTNAASTLDGAVRLGGDLRQYGTYGTAGSTKYAYSASFRPAAMIFCGSAPQRVYFDSTDSYFETASFEGEGIEGASVIFESDIDRLKLGSDAVVRFEGKDGRPASVTGTLDLNGHSLTIDGNYSQVSGTVNINKGALTINGNYSIGEAGETVAGSRKSTSTGILIMENAEDNLYVNGDFTVCSSGESVLTDGFMHVKGDFSQYGNRTDGNSDYASGTNFSATGNHKVTLDGEGMQKVSFESEESGFNKLELTQGMNQYEFSRTDCARELVYNGPPSIVSIGDCTYTGEPITPEVTVLQGMKALVEGEDYTIEFKNNINAATKDSENPPTVLVTYLGEVKGEPSATFNIRPRDMSDSGISVRAPETEYTGSPLTPEPTVTYGERVLEKDRDYTVSYENNTEIGLATVIVTGQGNFTGTASATFRILLPEALRKPISEAKNTAIPDMSYTGAGIEPEVELYDEGRQLAEGTDYTLGYYNNIKVGRAAVIIYGKGNYKGVSSIPFQIKQRVLSESTVTVDPIGSYIFTGKAMKPQVTVRADGVVLTEGKDYTLSYKNNVKASDSKTATVTVKGKKNCKGSRTASFTILPASLDTYENPDLSIVVSDAPYNKGKAVKTSVVIMDGTYKLKANTDYTLSYRNNTAISSYSPTVTITGKGNYAGSITSRSFRIYKSAIKTMSVSKIDVQAYTGYRICPKVTVTAKGKTLIEGRHYAVSYGANTNAGKGQVYIKGIGEYGGVKTVSFSIRRKPLNSGVAIEAIEDEDYNGSAHTPWLLVHDGTRSLVLNRDYTVKYTNNTNAGNPSSPKPPTATITGIGNYSGKLSRTFTIRPAALSKEENSDLTVTVSPAVFKNGKAVKPVVVVADGSTILKEKRDYTLSYANNTGISEAEGAYAPAVTVKGKGNYAAESVTVNFAIRADNIAKAKVSAVPAQSFTGLQVKPKVTVTLKGGQPLKEGVDYTLAYGENRKTGTGYIYILGAGTYGGCKTVKFKIQ